MSASFVFVVFKGFVAYKEFLQDVDAPMEVETQAYIDNFVFGRDQVTTQRHTFIVIISN